MMINRIQEFCTHLFQINHLVVYGKVIHIFLKTFNSEIQKTEVLFTDQNSQPLKIKNKMNLNLINK